MISPRFTAQQVLDLMDEILSQHDYLDDSWWALRGRLEALDSASQQRSKDLNEWEEVDHHE